MCRQNINMMADQRCAETKNWRGQKQDDALLITTEMRLIDEMLGSIFPTGLTVPQWERNAKLFRIGINRGTPAIAPEWRQYEVYV